MQSANETLEDTLSSSEEERVPFLQPFVYTAAAPASLVHTFDAFLSTREVDGLEEMSLGQVCIPTLYTC